MKLNEFGRGYIVLVICGFGVPFTNYVKKLRGKLICVRHGFNCSRHTILCGARSWSLPSKKLMFR